MDQLQVKKYSDDDHYEGEDFDDDNDDDNDEFVGVQQNNKYVQDSILKIAHVLCMKEVDLRGIFETFIYDTVIDDFELELIPFRVFKDFAVTVFGLSDKEIKALSVFFVDYTVGDALDIKPIELIFLKMNIISKDFPNLAAKS
jgi:hypothetical protein